MLRLLGKHPAVLVACRDAAVHHRAAAAHNPITPCCENPTFPPAFVPAQKHWVEEHAYM